MKCILKRAPLLLMFLLTMLGNPTDLFAANGTEVDFEINLGKDVNNPTKNNNNWFNINPGENSESAWKVKQLGRDYVLYNNMNTPDSTGFAYDCPLRVTRFSFDVGVDSELAKKSVKLQHYHVKHGEIDGTTSEGKCNNHYQNPENPDEEITCGQDLKAKCPLCGKIDVRGTDHSCPKDTFYFDDDDTSFVLLNCQINERTNKSTKLTGYVIVLNEGNGQTYNGIDKIEGVYYHNNVPNGVYYLVNCSLASSHLSHKDSSGKPVTNTKRHWEDLGKPEGIGYLVKKFDTNVYPVYGAYAYDAPTRPERSNITHGYNHISIEVVGDKYRFTLKRPNQNITYTEEFEADMSTPGFFGFATDSQPNCSFKNIKIRGIVPDINVTFDGNKGTGSTDPFIVDNRVDYAIFRTKNYIIGHWDDDAQKLTYTSLNQLPGVYRVGYLVDGDVGWNTKADGSGKKLTASSTWPCKGLKDVKVYVKWTPIKYHTNYILNLPVGCTSEAKDPGDNKMETREEWTFDKTRTINYLHWTLKGYHVDLDNVYNTAPNGSGESVPAFTDASNFSAKTTGVGYNENTHDLTWMESGTYHASNTNRKNLTSVDGAEINYYVQWIPNSYTIQYEKNAPSDTPLVSGSCANTAGTYDVYNTLASGFTAVGYTQTSWNTKANGSGDKYKLSAKDRNYTSTDGKTVTMYAQWEVNKYNIAFNPNIPSGWPHAVSGSMATVNNVKWNENKPLPANGYSCTGLVFTGWNTQPDGRGNAYGNGATVKGLTAVNGATVTLYAQWRPVEYYVAYNMNTPKDWPNVGTGSMANTGTPSSPCKYNTPFKLRKNAYAIPGAMFKGWTLTADGSGTVYADQQQVDKLTTVDKSTVTLYAKWEPIPYTVIYKANGGSGADVKETWIYNTFYNLYNNTPQLKNTAVSNKTPHFTKQGYYIDYWTISVTGTRVVEKDVKGNLSTGTAYGSDNAITSATKTHKNLCCPTDYGCVVTLTAHWTPIKYTVTYNNDTSVVNYKGYTASTDTHVTSNYDYDATYDLTNLSCSRSNKYGPSTFLGYGFKNGDASKNPVWYLAGRSPKKYATGRLSNIHSSHLSSLSTTSGVSFGNYFKFVNDGKIQSFNIYAVWDDCPGIEPIDLAWGGNTTDTNSIIVMDKMTNTSVRSGSEAEFQILQNASIKDSVWDREDNVSSLTADTLNSYYIDNFKQLKIHAAPTYDTGEVLPTSYELKYTVIDANGNKYQTSRKLYVGNTYDIKVGGSALHK